MTEQTEVETTIVNGLIVDVATGEVLDVLPHADEPFRVKDQATAEWVLEKLMIEESEVAALEARLAMLIENVESMQADHRRRAKFLRERFSAELEEWARSELDGKKTRTLRTPWGSLSLRRSAARTKLVDEPRALVWARENAPDAIKVTESLLISQVPPELLAQTPPGFEPVPAGEKFVIDTGMSR